MSHNQRRYSTYYIAGKSWALQNLIDKKFTPDALRPTAQRFSEMPDFESREFGRGALAGCDSYVKNMGDEDERETY